MIVACSHVLLVSDDVPRMMAFLTEVFGLPVHFANDEFGECVLPSGFRVAVFRATGNTRRFFEASGPRHTVALGVTVREVDQLHAVLKKALSKDLR